MASDATQHFGIATEGALAWPRPLIVVWAESAHPQSEHRRQDASALNEESIRHTEDRELGSVVACRLPAHPFRRHRRPSVPEKGGQDLSTSSLHALEWSQPLGSLRPAAGLRKDRARDTDSAGLQGNYAAPPGRWS